MIFFHKIQLHKMKLIILVILVSALAGASSDSIIGELPPKVISDLLSILTKGVFWVIDDCMQIKVTPRTEFKLFTRTDPQQGSIITEESLGQLQPNKPIVFITHGWLSSGNSTQPLALKDAYLNQTDSNVIITDWSSLASTWDYTSAYCMVPKVGEKLGNLVGNISTIPGLQWDTIHLIGHSLGAHVSGFAGEYVQKALGKNVSRITGLDPAGPGFQGRPLDTRLDASDASFVDVIHTNQGYAGYYGTIGDVDFYVNCGTFQPGCFKFDLGNIVEIIQLPVTYAICSHSRSWDYLTESVSSNQFQATNCPYCPLVCVRNLIRPHKIEMGENCPRNPPENKYVIKTNDKPPYALGENGFYLQDPQFAEIQQN